MRTKDQILLEQVYGGIILNEYSEGFLNQQIKRLKPQAGAFVEETAIRATLQRFDQLKTANNTSNRIKELVQQYIDSGDIKPDERNQKDVRRFENLKKQPLQVEFYNWSDLEKIVHQFRDPAEKAASKVEMAEGETGAEEIYKDPKNGIHVYFGKDPNSCILFKRFLSKEKEEEAKNESKDISKYYGWCISYPIERSLFYSYRFGSGDTSASVYFVYDETLPVSDDNHVIVIHAQRDGKFRLTNALNNRERVGDWNMVISQEWQPKLKGLEKLFVYRPLTEDEQIYQVTRNAGPSDFTNFTSYRVKRAYIDTRKKIYSKDYTELPAELQHTYINVRAPDAADEDMNSRLRKLLYLFADTDYESINKRMAQAMELAEQNKENWEAVLWEDSIMKNSKKSQTYKYWAKLIDDTLNDMGSAARADQRAQ
jgi:hypothetical protein